MSATETPPPSRQTYDPARHCGARRRSDDKKGPGRKGDRCLYAKGWGTKHVGSGRCRLHGGKTPPGEVDAARERASKALEGLGAPIPTDPQKGLLDMVAWAAGRIDAIAHQLHKLYEAEEPDRLLIDAMLREFGEERDRMARTAKVTIDADIAERQAKINEEVARVMVRAITAGLDAAGLRGDKRKAAIQAAVDELHRVDSEAPAGAALN